MRTCTKCNGAKQVASAFDPKKMRNCYSCKGAGSFPDVDYAGIIGAIKGRKGLRSARPKDMRTVESAREYYVWRMARFHGGFDVTMPMMAALELAHDPYQPELDALADQVAKAVFGTDLAAAHRWGALLGHVKGELSGLPVTAYEGGPVVLGPKPEEEEPELR